MLVSSSSVWGPCCVFPRRDRSSQATRPSIAGSSRPVTTANPCVSRFIIFVSLFFKLRIGRSTTLEQKWREINWESDARGNVWCDWRNGNASWFEARLLRVDRSCDRCVYSRAIYSLATTPTVHYQLRIRTGRCDVPVLLKERLTLLARCTPITRYLFPQSWRNTCSIPDWKDSFSTLQPLTENTTQLGGSIAGRSSSLIFECQTIFQRVAFMVDRIADWKLTPRLKLMVFFFFTLIRWRTRAKWNTGYRPSNKFLSINSNRLLLLLLRVANLFCDVESRVRKSSIGIIFCFDRYIVASLLRLTSDARNEIRLPRGRFQNME